MSDGSLNHIELVTCVQQGCFVSLYSFDMGAKATDESFDARRKADLDDSTDMLVHLGDGEQSTIGPCLWCCPG